MNENFQQGLEDIENDLHNNNNKTSGWINRIKKRRKKK